MLHGADLGTYSVKRGIFAKMEFASVRRGRRMMIGKIGSVVCR